MPAARDVPRASPASRYAMASSSPTATATGMVGKPELLRWASVVAGCRVGSFAELRDGAVLLRCVARTWPAGMRATRDVDAMAHRVRGSSDANFERIVRVFDAVGVPRAVLDVGGVRRATFRACYNVLVACFFLCNLARRRDFSVDFTHPVDAKIAAFLQAPESVASLAKGGALGGPGGGRTRTRAEKDDDDDANDANDARPDELKNRDAKDSSTSTTDEEEHAPRPNAADRAHVDPRQRPRPRRSGDAAGSADENADGPPPSGERRVRSISHWSQYDRVRVVNAIP